MTSLWRFFTSLRLTVVCLGFAILLVFLGTLAQVNEGLWQAQERWFKSAFIWWGPAGADWKIPVLPGGYLVGIVLVLNLIAAHIKRFKFTMRQLGINLTHIGIIMLLIGQLATDLLSEENVVSFREGETRNFVESHHDSEVAFATDAGDGQEQVVAVPEDIVAQKGEIRHEKLPFTVRVKEYSVNGTLRQRAPVADTAPPPATQGVGPRVTAIPAPEVKDMNNRNIPFAVVEILNAGASLGTWLVSPFLDPQEITLGDKVWRVSMRFEREYTPFSIKLLKTTHEVYRGTATASNPQGIPKNFQSRVQIINSRTNENREVDIYMNNPLRYEGMTFYQYQMGRDDRVSLGTSTLQVVRNPSWLTPYVGCAVVSLGMIVQFMYHLVGFIRKRQAA